MGTVKKWMVWMMGVLPLFAHAQTAARFDVLITEVMSDPSPQVGLPNSEYLELKNNSKLPLSLNGWKLSDASSTATINSSLIIPVDSFVILCTNASVAAFSVFGRTIGVSSFPSLDNEGDIISIRSPTGKSIHSITYSVAWHANALKEDGGWSLEMIDAANPCNGAENWTSSIHPSGGTPGKVNSVARSNPDLLPPSLLRAWAIDSVTLQLLFNEPLDSAVAASVSKYALAGNNILSAVPQSPAFDRVNLKLSNALSSGSVSNLHVSGISDCTGNSFGSDVSVRVGLAQQGALMDMIINEILFNPRSGGNDYVELYNRSGKIIDAAQLSLGNRDAQGNIASLKKLSNMPFYLFPGDYCVVSENIAGIANFYKYQEPLLLPGTLASYPDGSGDVVLINGSGTILDEVRYSEDWHFGLISDADGVALERLDPGRSGQDRYNWHSASSLSGFGTPGYRNSQASPATTSRGLAVEPLIFSPDNDGHSDIVEIHFDTDVPGAVVNIFIFDGNGRMLRPLVRNAIAGTKNVWIWDGLDKANNKLPIGPYIVFVEMVYLDGKTMHWKKPVFLARRL